MALKDLIKIDDSLRKIGISQERLEAIMPRLREQFAFWREYPDLFVDFMCGIDEKTGEKTKETLNLFFYQRVFMRAIMRHRLAYCTYPRA